MKKLIALVILALSFNAHAADDWTKNQIISEAVFMGLMVADYKQTKQIDGFCDNRTNCEVYETNKLLGRYPSEARVRNYFVSAAVMHVVVAHMLPTDTRDYWIASGIVLEAVVVGKNKRLGLRVKF